MAVHAPAKRPPPDIIWIVTTQWRALAMPTAGDPNVRAPNIKKFAARAINFPQAVTPHPLGPFARAALLTGQHSPYNGISTYYDPLPVNQRTVAEALNEQGYHTAFFGKWHLYTRDPNAPFVGEAHAKIIVPPENRGGFQFWEGFESGFLLNNPYLHGTRIPTPQQFPGYQSDILCQRAADYIKNTTGSSTPRPPLFCMISLEAPHPPYDAPASGFTPPKPENIILPKNVPLGGEIEQRARRELAGYYAHIEATDNSIGKLLKSLGDDTNTAIVFTSVHGDMHGSHGLFRKGWPHEESIRVPLLVKPPKSIPFKPGSSTNYLASLLDLPVWALDWAENKNPFAATPPDSQYISMPCATHIPLQCDRPWYAIRTLTTKTIYNPDKSPWLQNV